MGRKCLSQKELDEHALASGTPFPVALIQYFDQIIAFFQTKINETYLDLHVLKERILALRGKSQIKFLYYVVKIPSWRDNLAISAL